jgi:hypothetical protein
LFSNHTAKGEIRESSTEGNKKGSEMWKNVYRIKTTIARKNCSRIILSYDSGNNIASYKRKFKN